MANILKQYIIEISDFINECASSFNQRLQVKKFQDILNIWYFYIACAPKDMMMMHGNRISPLTEFERTDENLAKLYWQVSE